MSLQFCEWEDNDVHDIPYTSDVGKSTFHNDKCALRDNLLFAMILTIVANNLAFLFVIKYCLSGAFSFETSWQSHSLVFASQEDNDVNWISRDYQTQSYGWTQSFSGFDLYVILHPHLKLIRISHHDSYRAFFSYFFPPPSSCITSTEYQLKIILV